MSPDGKHLLFKEAVDRIVVSPLAGGADMLVASGQILSQTEPALSSDGQHVAYAIPQAHGDGWELRVASLKSPGSTILLAGGGDRLPLARASRGA